MEPDGEERLLRSARRIHEEITSLNPDATFVIVTKAQPIDVIQTLLDEGYRYFGENRVEQFVERQALFPEANWHFIGPLRRKNVAKVIGKTSLIHSVDSLKLLEKIERSCEAADVEQHVLLQVNISGEEQKQGFSPEVLRDTYSLLDMVAYPHVPIKGLMVMAPFVQDEEMIRSCFQGLRELRDELNGLFTGPSSFLEHLSMGMSNDYLIALEEGATMVRIGTAVFE